MYVLKNTLQDIDRDSKEDRPYESLKAQAFGSKPDQNPSTGNTDRYLDRTSSLSCSGDIPQMVAQQSPLEQAEQMKINHPLATTEHQCVASNLDHKTAHVRSRNDQ